MNEKYLDANIEPAEHIKLMIPVGAGLDVPNGMVIKGRRGEHILVGGLATFTGIVGKPNLFKSTIDRFMVHRAAARMRRSRGGTYDTESNQYEELLGRQSKRIPELLGEDMYKSKRWVLTNKNKYPGEKWYELHRTFLRNKEAHAKELEVNTPFWDRDCNGPMKMIMPTFGDVDSFTEFTVTAVEDIQQKAELGSTDANMIFMRKGLMQTRMLMEVPSMYAAASHFCVMTAQIGKEQAIGQAGPPGMPQETKLTDLKNGDKIKGVTDKFLSLTLACLQAVRARRMINDTTKAPEFPRSSDDDMRLDTDLTEVYIKNLRSKSGPSGNLQVIVISQSDGVLPSLTEFCYVRELKEANTKKRYGIDGSNVSYYLDMYPSVKLSRTTIRGKFDSDYKLRRAMNLTAEMCQMAELWHHHRTMYKMYPSDVFKVLTEKGYDMELLMMTREWWTYNDEEYPIPYLGTVDFLEMVLGRYHPYWYPCKVDEMLTEKGKEKVAAYKAKLQPFIAEQDIIAAVEEVPEVDTETGEINVAALLEPV
jgi:hypothetical protein